jgi:hypothetical protein
VQIVNNGEGAAEVLVSSPRPLFSGENPNPSGLGDDGTFGVVTSLEAPSGERGVPVGLARLVGGWWCSSAVVVGEFGELAAIIFGSLQL